MRGTKEIILLTVDDLVLHFMYEDRKEDDELPRGAIERALADGTITIDEIVDRFRGGVAHG